MNASADEDPPLFEIAVPAGEATVRAGDIAWWIAEALHPSSPHESDSQGVLRVIARRQHVKLMQRAVNEGRFEVLDRTSLTPHPFPIGDALLEARVKLSELRKYVRTLGGRLLIAQPASDVTQRHTGSDAWKEAAAELAREIIEREKARDLYPNQNNIADEVARDLRARGIFGPSGKPLRGETIKRHVLTPRKISSADYRQLSTAPRRGK